MSINAPNQQGQNNPVSNLLNGIVNAVVNHPQIKAIVNTLNKLPSNAGSALGLGALPLIAINKALEQQVRQQMASSPNAIKNPQFYGWRQRPETQLTKPYTPIGKTTPIPAKVVRANMPRTRPSSAVPYGGPGVYRMYRGEPVEQSAQGGYATGGEGMFLTTDPAYAHQYAEGQVAGGYKGHQGETNVHQYWAPIKNPINLDTTEGTNTFIRLAVKFGTPEEQKWARSMHPAGASKSGFVMPQTVSPKLAKAVRAAGYDAIYSTNELEGDYPTAIHLYPEKVIPDPSFASFQSTRQPAKPTSPQFQRYLQQAEKFFTPTGPMTSTKPTQQDIARASMIATSESPGEEP